ncbi:scavenger receptor [Branchiostoma belcheri]|nr:scavenger receptor [Branchiostoma belcheri]
MLCDVADILGEAIVDKPKTFWSYIKGLRKDLVGVTPLKVGNTIISDSGKKAEVLSSQFKSVFTEEDTTDMPSLGQPCTPPMEHIVVSTDGVEKMLQGLNPSKASGPDQIPPWFLKLTASEIAPVLTNIFQHSLNTAEIPKDWRDANICAIFKKGDRAVPSNYRPVSLTCISCKLLEHIIHSQIMKHLESYSILTDYQHGFRAKRSTETQLILTVHDIAGALNSKRQVDLAILDFTKAFDKVPHGRLISKLEYYGIQGPTLNWLKAFLTNREQTVVVEGKASAPVKVASGVPQGTVLGPLLFLLYINDLPDQLDSNVRLFADDCLLYVELSTQTDSQLLQKDLNTLEEWQSKWLMQFNPEKCYIMHITNKRTPHATSYQFCGQALATTKIHPYLGVTLTSGLKRIRLVEHGRWPHGPNEGRVEVRPVGSWTWGIVCAKHFDLRDADVVCRMLGYIWANSFSSFSYDGRRLAYMADLRCDGNESSLFNCSYAGWGSHDCEDGKYARVVCDPSRIRLIGGSGPNEGRVEVRPEDSMNWGTVCHNRFNMDDADVVCRMLGYPNAIQVQNDAYFGQGTGPIYMDDLRCDGNETSLFSCSYAGWTIHDCDHGQDAGVVCRTGSFAPRVGHVGVRVGKGRGKPRDSSSALVGRRAEDESRGFPRPFPPFPYPDAHVTYPGRKGSWECATHSSRIRLVGGSGPNEGRVEIRPADSFRWGTVCHNTFGFEDAEVVCRMLGYPNVYRVRPGAYFGRGMGPIYLEDLQCDGTESSLFNCSQKGWRVHDCDHWDDVGVVCGRGPIYMDDLHCNGDENSLFNCSYPGWTIHDLNCNHDQAAGVECTGEPFLLVSTWDGIFQIEVKDRLKVKMSSGSSRSLDYDPMTDFMYRASFRDIERARRDGSRLETIVELTNTYLRSLRLDHAGGNVYWGDNKGRISVARKDGSFVRRLLTLQGYPGELVLDPRNGDHNIVLLKSKHRTVNNRTLKQQTRPMKDSSIRAFGLTSAIKLRQSAFNNGKWEEWRKLRNKIQRGIKCAKSQFYKTRVQNLKKENPRAWFRELKVLTGGQRKEMTVRVEGIDPDNHHDIANKINKTFTGITTSLPLLELSQLPAFLPASPPPTVHPWQMYKKLQAVKTSKSPGPDGISGRLLKEFAYELSTPIADILNSSLREGCVPRDREWKEAVVVPLPKSDPPDIDKLRPVSLTSLIAKVCESFVAAWVLHDIVGNISRVQFGCLRGRSITHCLVSLANQLYKTADVRGTCSTWVLTDYSKAFDLVEHTMAMKHLLDLGVRSGILPWIANFHSGRSQRTRYHGVLSESKQLTCGLAQGTKLGPIVFIAHTNSSTDNIQSPTWAFVDDLNLIESRLLSDQSRLQNDLNELSTWSDKNNMKLNPGKCKTVHVCFCRNPSPPTPLSINGHVLEVVKTAKCLGVTFQSDLRWDTHVAEVTKKGSQRLHLLCHLRQFNGMAPRSHDNATTEDRKDPETRNQNHSWPQPTLRPVMQNPELTNSA